VYLPPVQADDPWAGKPIGIAIRAAGEAGGFWDLDGVRLAESLARCKRLFERYGIDILNELGQAQLVE